MKEVRRQRGKNNIEITLCVAWEWITWHGRCIPISRKRMNHSLFIILLFYSCYSVWKNGCHRDWWSSLFYLSCTVTQCWCPAHHHHLVPSHSLLRHYYHYHQSCVGGVKKKKKGWNSSRVLGSNSHIWVMHLCLSTFVCLCVWINNKRNEHVYPTDVSWWWWWSDWMMINERMSVLVALEDDVFLHHASPRYIAASLFELLLILHGFIPSSLIRCFAPTESN